MLFAIEIDYLCAMQQTALNLIAIGVFSITFLSLLSPILNISPLIPAGITLGIMGFATVDTLGLGNRGITLILDSFSSPEERKRILHHEAGHFLVAYFLSIPVTGYTLTAWEAFRQGQPGRGGVVFDRDGLSEKILAQQAPLIVERFSTVLMGGIAAENLIYGKSQGGEEDRLQLRSVLMSVGQNPQVHQQKERWALLQATNIIKQNRESYEALVKAMEAKASVDDCYKAIQQKCESFS